MRSHTNTHTYPTKLLLFRSNWSSSVYCNHATCAW